MKSSTEQILLRFAEFDNKMFDIDPAHVAARGTYLVRRADDILSKCSNKEDSLAQTIWEATRISKNSSGASLMDWGIVSELTDDSLPMRHDLFTEFAKILRRQGKISPMQGKFVSMLYGVNRDPNFIMATIMSDEQTWIGLSAMPPITVVAAKTPETAIAQIDRLEKAALCFAFLADISESIFVENKIAICSLAESARLFFGKSGETKAPPRPNSEIPHPTAAATPKNRTTEPPSPGEPSSSTESQFIISCPKCGSEIKVPADVAGEIGECPYCGNEFTIPGVPGRAASAPGGGHEANVDPVIIDNWKNFAWRRWAARSIDLNLAGIVAFLLLLTVSRTILTFGAGRQFILWLSDTHNEAFSIMLNIALSLLVEAGVYAVFRTTPGKVLAGVAVCDDAGRKATGWQYLSRNMRLFVRGMWLGIPVASWFAYARQYDRVRNGWPSSYDFGHDCYAHSIRAAKKKDWTLPVLAILFNIPTVGVLKYLGSLFN